MNILSRGAELKIERANKHIQELGPIVQTFFEKNPHETFTEVDPLNGNKICKIRAIKVAPPVEIAVITGEILYLLRSALDHLVTQVATKRNVTVIKRTGFPIESTRDKFENVIARREIEQRLPDLCAVLRDLKPYKGGNDLLWWLHWINGQEKHQMLVPIAGSRIINKIELTRTTEEAFDIGLDRGGGWVRLDKDYVVMTLSPSGKAKGKIDAIFTVSLSEVNGLQFQPIGQTLTQFSDLVSGIVNIFRQRFFSD